MALNSVSCIFPAEDMVATAHYYERQLGFWQVEFMGSAMSHISMYRDGVEIMIVPSGKDEVQSNMERYGYGYDAYIYTDDLDALLAEYQAKDVEIVKEIDPDDQMDQEFVIKDCDGRLLAFGNRR